MNETLNLKIDGVVEVPGRHIYAKTPEALEALKEKMKALGYKLEVRPSSSSGQIWLAKLQSSDKKKKGKVSFFSPSSSLESIFIYEAWPWFPLRRSRELGEEIISAIGMITDCGFYYQDGRQEFYSFHLERMRIFVEGLTDIPIAEWDAMIKKAPLSGPGMVKAVAAFCQNVPDYCVQVEDSPNVAHLLLGFSKIRNHQPRTGSEIAAMNKAAANREIRKDFLDTIGG
ncbi:MAG: hypothetical protein HY931_00760 [Candidatus Falkowbacteria bacterium]|nr:MAG: hypothetical protein HY931_00760 [Candidatus Falkowbacteria bacterium]